MPAGSTVITSPVVLGVARTRRELFVLYTLVEGALEEAAGVCGTVEGASGSDTDGCSALPEVATVTGVVEVSLCSPPPLVQALTISISIISTSTGAAILIILSVEIPIFSAFFL